MQAYDVEHSDAKYSTKVFYLNNENTEKYFHHDLSVYKLTRKVDRMKVVGYVDTNSRAGNHYYESRDDVKPFNYLYFSLREDEVDARILAEIKTNEMTIYPTGGSQKEKSNNIKCYLPVYKTLHGQPEAFIKISKDECIGIGKRKEIPRVLIALIAVGFSGLLLIAGHFNAPPQVSSTEPEVVVAADNPPDEKNPLNIGDYGDIGDYTKVEEDIKPNTDMAYICGSSTSKVTQRNPYVELKNLGQNTDYLFEYYVYKDDAEIFHTDGLIPANKEALWDAYNCTSIQRGENKVNYTVNVYDYNGNKVTGADITGITIIKN